MFRTDPVLDAPLPALRPYVRCTCGVCRECKDNEKWDRIFAEKFAAKSHHEERGMFASPLSDF